MMTQDNQEAQINEFSRQCETHEGFLKELLRGRYACLQGYLGDGLRFGIARRWNSWYPSYFDVEGGCYVLIPGDLDPQFEKNKKDEGLGVIVIDPGFKFIDILRTTYQIEPQDIKTVIVTHFHPDHMAGLLEYATIMNTSKQSCNIYLNETAFESFKTLQNAFISVNELRDGQIQEIMRYRTIDQKTVRVSVKAINVHHNEMGNQHRSLGLILESQLITNHTSAGETIKRARIGILGDTDGNEEYIPFYVENFSQVDILILHLGTFSNKKFGRGGKHLYINGVQQILKQMREHWQAGNRMDRKVVVLSEFGLEMADDDTLYQKLQPFIESHSWRLPLIYANLYLDDKGALPAGRSGRDGSHLFARAILDLLKKINYDGKRSGSYPSSLSRKEADEFLLAFALQIIAVEFGQDDFRGAVRDMSGALMCLINREKKEKLTDGLPVETYLRFLNQKLEKCDRVSHLMRFMQNVVETANFGAIPLPWDSLIAGCDQLVYRVGDNLASPANILYYLDKLPYIQKFAASRSLSFEDATQRTKNYWSFDGKGGIHGLEEFWSACLIGVYLLRKTLLDHANRDPAGAQENLLINIGKFFQNDDDSWANILIGDIGCTFGIYPLDKHNDNQRIPGIFIQAPNGQWVSPYEAHSVFDHENNRMLYPLKPQGKTP